ncbi:unnamed protein product [Orchesella dallaii]|uniref:Uncharacterized protein n=1 Tax=Orchesella dallaii TaxID=48710 RepID=A0ABP1QJG0_9HEXA
MLKTLDNVVGIDMPSFLAKLLFLASTCTVHYCGDNENQNSKAFDELINVSIDHSHILLLTLDSKDSFLVKNVTYNNWYKENMYQSGRFEGKVYRQGYWQLFKSAKYLDSCQLQIVDIKRSWKQVGRTNAEIPSENESGVGMSVHSVYSPLPLFFIINNEALHFVPRTIQGRFYYDITRKTFDRYIFPFKTLKIEKIKSTSQLQKVWRSEFLYKNNIFGRRQEAVKKASHCHDVLFRNYNWTQRLQRFHSREIQGCLENTLISMNFSAIHFRSHQLDSGSSSKDFIPLLRQYPYIFRYDTSFHGFRYLVFWDWDLNRIGKKIHVDIFAILRPFSTYFWISAAASVFTVSTFLMISGERQSLLYTVSLFLEQGDVGLGQKSYGTPIIISVWLFASFILRLSYCSSKYSYLTLEAAVPVPNSFEECVSDINFHKFAEYNDGIDVFNRMSYSYDETQNKLFILNSTHKLLRKLSKSIYNLKLLEDGSWNGFDPTVPFQIRTLANHSNNVYVDTMSVKPVPESATHYSQVVMSEESVMVTANRFAYIYNYPLSIRDDDTGVEVFAVMLFGGKRGFRNYELQMFNILRGWVGEADISTVMADEMVGKLEQSGILLKWKTTTNAMNILSSWRRLHRSVFGRKKSMNLVQIAYDIVEFKGVVKYLDEVDAQDDIGGVSNMALLSVWIVFSIACIVSMSIFVWELPFCVTNAL